MLREQDLLEPENILKLVLINLPCCINFPGQSKVTLRAILESARVWKLNPVLRTPLPGSVEVFQSEPVGINAFMTSVTGRVILVLLNLLTEGGDLLTVFGLDCLYLFRGRRKCVAHNILGNPRAPPDGRSIKTICGHLEHAPHG